MRLTRYLLREYVIICVVSYFSLLFFFSLFEFAEFVRITAQAKREIALVWRMTGWNLFVLSNEVGPLALLLSITFFGATLSRRGEIIGIFGSGVSPLKVIGPIALVTALFCAGLAVIADWVAPHAVSAIERITLWELNRWTGSQAYFNSRRHWFHVGDKFVRVGDIDPDHQRYIDMTVLDVRDGHLQARYHIDDVQSLGTELLGRDVMIERYPLGEDGREREQAEELILPLARSFNAFLDFAMRPQRMVLEQLHEAAEARSRQGYDPTAYEAEYYARLLFPFTVLGLVLLGATFALRVDVKRSFVRALGELLALTLGAFLVRQVFRSLSNGGLVHPLIGAAGPFFTFIGYAAYRLRDALGFRRLDWLRRARWISPRPKQA